MLSRILVSSYKAFIEIALWLHFLVFVIGGYILGAVGDNQIMGAIAGLIVGFLLAVLIWGAALVLCDIRQSVLAIEKKHTS